MKVLMADYAIIMIIINVRPASFSHLRELMIFDRSLSDGKSPQVSKTLLNILSDFDNTVVW